MPILFLSPERLLHISKDMAGSAFLSYRFGAPESVCPFPRLESVSSALLIYILRDGFQKYLLLKNR